MKQPILLRDARKQKKLTQERLAALSGVDQTTISRLEVGDPNPTRSTVEKLARALNLAPSRLRFDAPGPDRSLAGASDRPGHEEAR